MKNFKVIYFEPSNPKDIFEDIIFAKNEIIAKAQVRKEGFEVKEIYEVENKETSIEKIKNLLNHDSIGVGYNPEIETNLLKAFAVSLKDGFEQKEALENTKDIFGKNEKKIRSIIDKMVDDMDRPNITHIYDVFKENDNVFSESFLTLMKQSKDTEIKMDKIISNPVKEEDKGNKVEGYVELTTAINKLKKNIVTAISGPLRSFLLLFLGSLAILIFLMPNLIDGASKIRDNSLDDYTFVGNSLILFSNFVTTYGFYVLIGLIALGSFFGFLYKTNSSIREQVHLFLVKIPIISDIIQVFLTKKITSYLAIFIESGMNFKKAFTLVIPLVGNIPVQKELEYIKNRIPDDFDTVFKSYPDDEKYLTEVFYKQLARESNRNSSITGRFAKAFASILKNTDDKWEISLKKYPQKIGVYIEWIAKIIIVYFIIGIALILLKTTTAGL